MADVSAWDTLRTAWNGPQPPAGVTGTPLTPGMTTQQKLDAVNGWTVVGPTQPARLPASDILNAIVPADLAALTPAQVSMLTLLLLGNQVDASQGSTIRTAVRNIFAGKTQTLANLGTLVEPYDNPKIKWTTANGYGPRITLDDVAPDKANLT